MEFKPGKKIKEFSAKNKTGKTGKIIFRFPSLSLAKHMVKWINKVRKEAQYLGNWRKETLKSERKFIKKTIKDMKEKKGFHIVVQNGENVVGGATIGPKPHDAQKHVGTFGIGLLKKYSGIGIGYKLGKTTIEIAKNHTNLTIIDSSYNSDNKVSAILHKKLRFKIAGKIPRGIKSKYGKYSAEVILYKQIK